MGHTSRHQSASVAGVCLMALLASSCLSGLLAPAAWAQSAGDGAGALRHYTIAAQPLRTALHQYLEQSGVQVAYLPPPACQSVRVAIQESWPERQLRAFNPSKLSFGEIVR